MDKSLSGLHTNTVLLFTYIAPEYSKVYDFRNTNGIDILGNKLTAVLSDLDDVSIILAGDLNSRVKDLLDYIPVDNIDHIFYENLDYPGDTFSMQRRNRDNVLNKFGNR